MNGSQAVDPNQVAGANAAQDAGPVPVKPVAGRLSTSTHEIYQNAKDCLKRFPKTLRSRPNPYNELTLAYEKYMKIDEKGAAATAQDKQAQAALLSAIEQAIKDIGASKKMSFYEGTGENKIEITTIKQMLKKFEKGEQESSRSWKKRLYDKDAVLITLDGKSSGLYITGGFDADAEVSNELRGQQRDWGASFLIMLRNLYAATFLSDDRACNSVTQKFVDRWNAGNENASNNFKLVFNPEKFGSMIVAQSKTDPTQIMDLEDALRTCDFTTSDLVGALNADYKRAGLRHTITLKGNDLGNKAEFNDGSKKQSLELDDGSKKQSAEFINPPRKQSVGFNNNPAGIAADTDASKQPPAGLVDNKPAGPAPGSTLTRDTKETIDTKKTIDAEKRNLNNSDYVTPGIEV